MKQSGADYDFGWMTPEVTTLNAANNTTVVIPAGYTILQLVIENTAANGIVGGLRIGTTNLGVDVAVAIAVTGNSLITVPDSSLLKRAFSRTLDQTLYLHAVTLWNGANVNFTFVLARFAP